VHEASLKKAYRNAWILVVLAAIFVVVVVLFVFRTNKNPPQRTWNMGGVPFVPASSSYAEGYYSPVDAPAKGSDK
jgi:bacteriorhodopsin